MTKPRVTPNNAFKAAPRVLGAEISTGPLPYQRVGTQPPVSEVQ